jgi:hypothetical protein
MIQSYCHELMEAIRALENKNAAKDIELLKMSAIR